MLAFYWKGIIRAHVDMALKAQTRMQGINNSASLGTDVPTAFSCSFPWGCLKAFMHVYINTSEGVSLKEAPGWTQSQ